MIDAFKGETIAGAFYAVGLNGAFEACAEILLNAEGRKFIAAAMRPPEKIPHGISTKFIWAGTIKDNEVSTAIYVDFLPKALAEGKYVASPDPQVVGKGLEYVQAGLEISKNGVSAKKVVISL